ncbi:LysE family translocator [Fulvivirgaceae bacterium PWU4]|uniref:LysE family translocator n=1 Tax=Chryseosolibacter histidini TaxID=2782349 RepID=A0AAP2DMD0_9BACT|nr:LysE family translocator [Chryseosolibacter histidini]MBT1696674.1 LysE family translocator [Chryseosolibacter histidini]
MSGIVNYEAFVLACILLNLTPGNDTIFILTRSIGQGKKAGVISALGIGTGNIVHTMLAAFGLSLIITQSIVLFTAIKYAGAVYLIYIGYKMITEKASLHTDVIPTHAVDYTTIYRDGVITNVLNPKVALFFMAFLPQFIDPAMENTILPFLMLGATFTTTGTIWCLILATFSAAIFSKLKTNRRAAGYINKICGMALVALGIKVALTDRR